MNRNKMYTYFWKVYSKVKKFHHFRRFCDVIIQVQDQTFHCHRVVLASMSLYFDAMFGGHFKEKDSSVIVLEDVDAVIFESILQFMYTGRQPEINGGNIYDLLYASEFFGLQDLKGLCEQFLMRCMTSNVVSSFNVAKLFRFFRCTQAGGIMESILRIHILTHLVTFTRTEMFLDMQYDDLSAVLKVYRNFASTSVPYANENFLLDGLIRWVHHAYDERRQYLGELIDIVDFEKISTDYARFLTNEYEIEKVEARSADDQILRVKSTIIESKAPPSPYQHVLSQSSRATIHVYKTFPILDVDSIIPNVYRDVYTVHTLNEQKAEPDWYISSSFQLPLRRSTKSLRLRIPLTFVASEKLDFIYCLYHDHTSLFYAYPHSDFADSRHLTIGSPMREFFRPTLCVSDEHVYMYNPEMHTFNYYRSVGIWDCKIFSMDEYKRGIYCYTSAIDAWSPVPEMKRKLASSCLVADNLNNLLYLIGGDDSDGRLPPGYVQVYDRRTPAWREGRRSIHSYSHNTTSCSLNGKIYVTNQIAMEVFDPVAGKWETISFPSIERAYGQQQASEIWMVSHENRVYFFHKPSSTMSILDIATWRWSQPISFRDAIGTDNDPDLMCQWYGLQNVIVFRPMQAWGYAG